MPWSPPFDEDGSPDPRLDPYRGRAARLSLDGEPSGYLLVETQEARFKAGGFAWWSRWDPAEEIAVVATQVGDTDETSALVRDGLAAAIASWGRGQHTIRGTAYDVSWLDEAESDRVHREIFGHHHESPGH
jgi:hypothetical protein